jgi:hypothetical protein
MLRPTSWPICVFSRGSPDELLAGRPPAVKVPPRFKDGAAWVFVAPHKEREGVQLSARLGPPTADELAKEPWRNVAIVTRGTAPSDRGQYEVSDEELHDLERYKVSTLAEVDDLSSGSSGTRASSSSSTTTLSTTPTTGRSERETS